MTLNDGYNRTFRYLRLSLTEVCNFRCSYCLPDGYKKCHNTTPLNTSELIRVAKAFSELGLEKIRLTGGEPTIRPDFLEIVRAISALPHVKKLAITTNGYKLKERTQLWRDAGITNINISLDSLNPKRFKEITGHDRCNDVLDGIYAALDVGFRSVKINTVYLKGLNDEEVTDFIQITRKNPVSVRFIELMETGDQHDYFHKHHISTDIILDQLTRNGWTKVIRANTAGPAIEFKHPSHLGRVGIIAPYSNDFCKNCNRLRFSSIGKLHLCLFGEFGISMRHLLQSDGQLEELKNAIVNATMKKTESHALHDGKTGQTANLSYIGG